MKNLGKEIWYADAERSDSPKKILVYSDQGKLNTNGKQLVFEGENGHLQIDRIERIYMANQQLNWVPYLLTIVGFMFLGSIFEMFEWMFWSMLGVFPICIALFWFAFKWVVVEYSSDGKPDRAYFSDGRQSGFTGLLGGNRTLYREMQQSVAEHENKSG